MLQHKRANRPLEPQKVLSAGRQEEERHNAKCQNDDHKPRQSHASNLDARYDGVIASR
jgi:hypothetical protein